MTQNATKQIAQMINRINEKNPYYVVIGAVVALLVLDYICVLQFQVRTLSSLNPKTKTLADDYDSTNNNIKRLPQYQKEVRRLEGQLERVSRKIRTREEIPQILENISVVANENGVHIEQIMPNTTVEEPILKNNDGQYFIVPIIVEGRSSYHDFGRFFNQLEEEGVLLNVPDFTIAANAQEPRLHRVKLTINAIVLEKTL